MTDGTTARLSWLHASTSANQAKTKTITSGPNTTRTRNAPRRRYEVHGERTCYRCRRTGHYARECPHTYSQQSTETKVETMKNLIRSMTLNERSKFKAYVLGKDEQQKISMNMLSRETSPHANRIPAAVPPSRETGPRTNQSMERLAEALK